MRKVLSISRCLADILGLSGWRQHDYLQNKFKRQYRHVQRLRHSTSKDESKKQQQLQRIQDSHTLYLEMAINNLLKAKETLSQVSDNDPLTMIKRCELENFIIHAERQIDQIHRRVLNNEKIPHHEKVFSLFQPHTEWISKGKAGVPVELGLRVCVMEDNSRFILHHLVMEKTTDDKVAVQIVEETKARFPMVKAVSMDKGFHSKQNQLDLKDHLETIVLPKKGKWSKADKERESTPTFIEMRKQHSAVESAINALQVHGLNKCPDHGIDGFKRYVSLSIVARNIQRLGAVIRQEIKDKENRKRGPYKKAA